MAGRVGDEKLGAMLGSWIIFGAVLLGVGFRGGWKLGLYGGRCLGEMCRCWGAFLELDRARLLSSQQTTGSVYSRV